MCVKMDMGNDLAWSTAQDATDCCGGKMGLHRTDSGGFEVVVFHGISGFSPVTGSQRNISVGGTRFYDSLV